MRARYTKKLFILIFLTVVVITAVRFLNDPTPPLDPVAHAPETITEESIMILAENLSVPWGIAFLPDGELLITERTGTLAFLNSTSGAIERIEVLGVDEFGEGGLLGLVLHPDFSNNHWVYLYETREGEIGTTNRVVRYTFKNGILSSPTVIIENIPGARYHDGGRMAFGPPTACASGQANCLLYITTGDAGNKPLAQKTQSLAGKILRLHDDGSIPDDNPFANEIYSYGHRNPQGLAWDDGGNLWSTEHGRSGIQSGYDELNLIVKGGNYGWPEIQGDETREGMIAPVIHSGSDVTWAPASLAYHDSKLYWGGLRGETLYEATINDNLATNLVEHFKSKFGRLRFVGLSPDKKYLYVSTSNTDGRGDVQSGDDKIIRIPLEFLR